MEKSVSNQETSGTIGKLDDHTNEQIMKDVFIKVHQLSVNLGCQVFLKVIDTTLNSLIYGTKDLLAVYDTQGLKADNNDIPVCIEDMSKSTDTIFDKCSVRTTGTHIQGDDSKPVTVNDNSVTIEDTVNKPTKSIYNHVYSRISETGGITAEVQDVSRKAETYSVSLTETSVRRTSRRKQSVPKRSSSPDIVATTAKRRKVISRKTKKVSEKGKPRLPYVVTIATEQDSNEDDDIIDDVRDEDYEPCQKPKRKYTFINRKPRALPVSTGGICKICGEHFAKFLDLRAHRKKHTKEKVKCKECGKSLSGYTSLLQHINVVHKKERPFKCNVCQKTFTSASHLTTHNEMHATAEQKKLQCSRCEKRFVHSTSLKAHERMTHREKLYECETCGKRFPQKANLVVHIRCHTGERPYQCDECGKTFSQLSSLRSHKFIHTGEKPFKCTMCEYAFVRADDLKAHIRRHTGERPFQCEICGKRFSKSQQLADHKRHHTGDKRYKCKVCGGTFFKSGHLKRHMTIHSGEKPFECEVCGKKVNRADNLKTHMKVHRKDVEGGQGKEKCAKKTKLTAINESDIPPIRVNPHVAETFTPTCSSNQPHTANVTSSYPPQYCQEQERMYVEPLAIQSAIDTIGGLQHEQW